MIVIAGADDLAVLQHQDQIRMAQGTDPLGHQHGGGMAVIAAQGAAQISIGPVIQSGG